MADHEKVYSVKFITDQAETSIKRLEGFVLQFEKVLTRAFGGASLSKAVDSLKTKISTVDKSVSSGFRKIDDAALKMRAEFEKNVASMGRLGTTGSNASSKVVSGTSAISSAMERTRRVAEALDGILKKASKDGAAGMREIGRAVKSSETAVRSTDEAIQRMTRVKGEREKARALREVERRIQGIGNSSRIATMSVTGLMARMSAILGIARGVRAIGDEFIGFDKAMVGASIRFDETMRVGTAGYTNMRREVRRLAVEAGASVEAAAKSTEAWSKAGLNWKQTEKVMPVTLRAALAMDLPDPGTAGDLLSDSLGQFQMRTSDTAQLEKNIKRISDVTLKAADISTLDATDLFDSYKKGAPMVAAMSETIEQLAADLVTLGNAGIKGEEAGTTIRSIFGALTSPRGPAREVMEDLGVEINDAKGNFRGLTNIIADFEESTRNIGSGERVGMLTRVVGRENISGFLDLLASGADEIRRVQVELENSSGTMDKVAEQMEKSVAKKWDRLKSRVVDTGISVLEQTDLFGKLGSAVESIDWNSVSSTISNTIIPALQKAGTIISDVVFPAIKNAAHLIEAVFDPVIWLASKALDGASKGGQGLAKVIGTLIALWATYRAATVAMMAVDLVRYFASLIRKLTDTAAAQTALTGATTGTTTAMGLLSKAVGVVGAAFAGWTIGTIIREQIVDPALEAIQTIDRLKQSVEDSRKKDEEILKGKKPEKAVSVLESDLKEREKLLKTERDRDTQRKFDAQSRGIYLGDEKSPEVLKLEAEVANLKNRIILENKKKQIEKYSVDGPLRDEEQTSDMRDQSGVSVMDWQDNFEEGSFQTPEPLRTRIFQNPNDQSFEYDNLFEVADQSVPTYYKDPEVFQKGKSFEKPEDFMLDQSVPEGAVPTSFETFDKMYELQLQTSDEAREFQQKMLDGALNRSGSYNTNTRTVTQTISYTGPSIKIDAANMTPDQIEKMMKRVLRDDKREMSKQARQAADDAGRTEF